MESKERYKRIVAILRGAGYDLDDVGEVVGQHRQTVYNQLRGLSALRASTAIVTARLTGIPVEVLADPTGELRAGAEAKAQAASASLALEEVHA